MMKNSISGVLASLLFCLWGAVAACAADTQSFAGSASCAECHATETTAWSQSDHAWALREPDATSVLGDFNDARFTLKGITTRFFQKDGHYWVETDGPDGRLTQYQVRYTVGVRPLQQYLVETGNGRLQVLDIAWDAMARKWFHLYPDQDASAGNGMHWTGTYKNWQARCAECHQTGFDKGYDLQSGTYKSHWAELTVSCESCHGPSSAHVQAARAAKAGTHSAASENLMKLGPGQQANELAVCGPCHARREAFAQASAPVGSTLSDHYNLALLTPDLYFADGQQDAEDYILGSFLQSKMMAKGVTCSNCHDPHSGKLVAEGNAVCTQCHSTTGRAEFPTLARKDYDTAAHTHHKDGTDGAQCVSCHMPDRVYMQIDKRRDHFFRRPDPLQSKAAGAPDVCTRCHADKSPEWAAQQIAAWFPAVDRGWQDRAPFVAFHAGDRSQTVLDALAAYAADLGRPAIVRATAADMLQDTGDPALKDKLQSLLRDPSDLVRAAAAGLSREADPPAKVSLLSPLLADPSRLVRQSAAVQLAGTDPATLSAADAAALSKALAEYLDSRRANADMPEAHMALAGLALSMRQWPSAEAAFKQAVSMDPQLEQGWLMLARIRAALGDEPGAGQYLDKGIGYLPRGISLLFERAAFESRAGNDKKAIDWLRRITAIDPQDADAWLQIAAAALRIQDAGLVIDAAGKVMELQPANTDGYVVAAIGHYIQGDTAAAKALAAKAVAIDAKVQLPAEIAALLKGP
jgi:predicted CXXCH cytochrome family protein